MSVEVETAVFSILFLAGLLLFRAFWHSRPVAVLVSLSSLVFVLASGALLLADFFTGSGIDESVVFHLRIGLQGAAFREYPGVLAAGAAVFVTALLLALAVLRILGRDRHRGPVWGRVAALGLLATVLALNPASRDVYALYQLETSGTAAPAAVPEFYHGPRPGAPADPPNLLFIYLESVERTYLDQALFPGLTPNLTALEREALSFTDIRQVYGTSWTMGGMVATQCGLPLYTPAHGNSMAGMDTFLPGASCIGELLAGAGYALHYLGGADLEFAGKGLFYETHGFDHVEGLHELLPRMPDPEYRSHWGLYDDSLLDLVSERFDALAGVGPPLGLFALTLDTHHPRGHLSASCRDHPYGDGSDPILNAVHCTDRLVGALVDGVRRNEQARDTVIVLVSDHLAMRNTAWDRLALGERRNLFMVLRPGAAVPESIARAGSLLDVGPTVLSLLGFDLNALGFGRDLQREQATAVETFPDVDGFLASQRNALLGLWGFPQMGRRIAVDPDREVLRLGRREVRLPALLVLDEDLSVEEIRFDFFSPDPLMREVAALSPAQDMVWVDQCRWLEALHTGASASSRDGAGEEWCVAFGSLGSKELQVFRASENRSIPVRDMRRLTAKRDAPSAALRDQRAQWLENLAAHGAADVRHVNLQPAAGLDRALEVRSSGFGAGRSQVRWQWGDEPWAADKVFAARGLTLVGIGAAGPVKLGHFDSCDPDDPVHDATGFRGPFADLIANQADRYGAFVVLAHDSAVCDDSTAPARVMAGLGLAEWRRIGHRQPYVGVVSAAGERLEFLGRSEDAMVVVFAAPRADR